METLKNIDDSAPDPSFVGGVPFDHIRKYSRPFTFDEAKQYQEFIDDFFSNVEYPQPRTGDQ